MAEEPAKKRAKPRYARCGVTYEHCAKMAQWTVDGVGPHCTAHMLVRWNQPHTVIDGIPWHYRDGLANEAVSDMNACRRGVGRLRLSTVVQSIHGDSWATYSLTSETLWKSSPLAGATLPPRAIQLRALNPRHMPPPPNNGQPGGAQIRTLESLLFRMIVRPLVDLVAWRKSQDEMRRAGDPTTFVMETVFEDPREEHAFVWVAPNGGEVVFPPRLLGSMAASLYEKVVRVPGSEANDEYMRVHGRLLTGSDIQILCPEIKRTGIVKEELVAAARNRFYTMPFEVVLAAMLAADIYGHRAPWADDMTEINGMLARAEPRAVPEPVVPAGPAPAVHAPMCVVCMVDYPNVAILPCRHLALCSGCAARGFSTCPVCRGPVQQLLRLFA